MHQVSHVRKYLDYLGPKLHYNLLQDWLQCSKLDFTTHQGSVLTQRYNNSPLQLLKSCYPNFEWNPWMFRHCFRGFWNSLDNQRRYLDWIGALFGYTLLEHWFKVTANDFSEHYGDTLLRRNNGSIYQIIATNYPNFEWKPWLFARACNRFWEDLSNQREYLSWVGKRLGFLGLEDMYKINVSSFEENCGSGLLCRFEKSPSRFLKIAFPNFDWKPWLFDRASQNYWDDSNNVRKYVEYIGKTLGFSNFQDWYYITHKDYVRSLLIKYKHHYYFLREVYPNFDWKPWLFARSPRRLWKNSNFQRKYIDWLGEKLGFYCFEDFYKINKNDFTDNCGTTLLSVHYGGSIPKILKTIYSKFHWELWKFSKTTTEFGVDDTLNYLRYLSFEMKITHLDEWTRISQEQLNKHGKYISIQRHGGLRSLLKLMHPYYHWKMNSLSTPTKRSTQRCLFLAVSHIFPGETILEEHVHPSLARYSTGKNLEFDIWVERFDLAVEFQGAQHFQEVSVFAGSGSNLEHYRELDEEKRVLCERANVALITVPWWWNRSFNALFTTIFDQIPASKLFLKTIPSLSAELQSVLWL